MTGVELIREDFCNSLVFIDKLKAKEILSGFVSNDQLMPFIEKVAAATLVRIGDIPEGWKIRKLRNILAKMLYFSY